MTVRDDSSFNDMQAQRIQMKLYRDLELQTDQSESLAARWHSWCRRRRNLDKQLTAALRRLQNLLAPAEVIPSAALQIVLGVLGIPHSQTPQEKHGECYHATHASSCVVDATASQPLMV